MGESPKEVQKRIMAMFERVKDAAYGDVFEVSDTIKLDPDSLTYVVGELQNYSIMEADRDAIGDAFEVFIGPALRGSEGQFFTPRNVVEMMVKIVDPKPGERIIDPACGSGGFLITALAHVWGKLCDEAKRKGCSRWPPIVSGASTRTSSWRRFAKRIWRSSAMDAAGCSVKIRWNE